MKTEACLVRSRYWEDEHLEKEKEKHNLWQEKHCKEKEEREWLKKEAREVERASKRESSCLAQANEEECNRKIK